MMLRLL